MKPALLLVFMLVLVSCQRGTVPRDGGPGKDVPAAPLAKRAPCPEGTETKGSPPPEGIEEWCQKPDGVLHGRSTIWHRNRFKAAEGEYQNNEKHGRWTYWHPNGKKASSGEFSQGKKHGIWTVWDESGEKTHEIEYRDGIEVRK